MKKMTYWAIALFAFVILLMVIIAGSFGTSTVNEASFLFAADEEGQSMYETIYYPAIIDIYKEKKVLVPLSWMWAVGVSSEVEIQSIEQVKLWAEEVAYRPEYYRTKTDIDEEGNEYTWEELIPENELNCSSEEACDAKGYIKKYGLYTRDEFAQNVMDKLGNGVLPNYFFEIVLEFEPLDSILFADFDLNDAEMIEGIEDAWDQEILIPFDNYTITCEFGCYAGHNAIDLQPVPRSVADGHQIRAGCSGNITQNTYHPNGGNYVTIDCFDSSLGLYYGHMVRRSTYSIGDSINKGDIIGYVGSTGVATGPHVHWKFLINGQAVNPRLIFEFR